MKSNDIPDDDADGLVSKAPANAAKGGGLAGGLDRKTTKHDWVEDFAHENGNYWCVCLRCGEKFTGHKRRVVCHHCTFPFGKPPTTGDDT